MSLKTIICKYSDNEKLTKNTPISVHWLALCTLLCPLFSPAHAFTSLHYLKHKGISLYPLSSLLPLYFFLCSTSLSSALLISSLDFPWLSYLLTSLLFLSHILSSMSLCSSHLLSHLLSTSTLHSLPGFPPHPSSCPLFLSHHPFLTSLSTPSFLPLSISSPLTTTVRPLMIAECISFDMKTKG